MFPRIIPVFISSPNDVTLERKKVKSVLSDLSQILERIFGFVLTPVSWEEFRSFAAEKKIQETINKNLEKSFLFIGILGKRYGTIHDDGKSSTHQEFDFAISLKHKIEILVYKKISNENYADAEDIQQIHLLNQLIKEIKKEEILYKSYTEINEFQECVLLGILETVLEMIVEAKRRDLLNKFFLFGKSRSQREVSVLMGYPSIHSQYGKMHEKTFNWQERLVPNVVYEDFRAIRKIESVLNCIGVTDHKAVTTYYSDLQEPGNRIWLCLPRNKIAQQKLALFKDRVFFKFRGNNFKSRHLCWFPPNQKTIKIRSPLYKYLSYQRSSKKTVWRPSYGNNLARDYAILARFKNDIESKGHGTDNFYHYFFAGIRGLGTWCVGWYIDECYDDLINITDKYGDGDVQLIFEVTYLRYRIKDVKNVTNMDQNYFEL